MCGIAGMLGPAQSHADRARLQKMIGVLRHRGPDHQGLWVNQNVGFAHARLSVVDLSDGANQPMTDASSRYVIVYNGEIYNYKEIREELRGKGHQFRTASDTEVILEAYKAWGTDCHRRFNGMWAFALYDQLERTLLLSRDRFGVKPLFFTKIGDTWFFASEIKSLLSAGAPAELNREALRWYLEDAGCDRGTMTMFAGIHSVAAGSYLAFRPDLAVDTVKWWETADCLRDVPDDFRSRQEEFRDILLDAVRLRMRTDTSTALTLSGGMDSSSVYAAYHDLRKKGQALSATAADEIQLTPFVVSYPGEAIDEAPAARRLAGHFGDRITVVVPQPGDFRRLVQEVTWHQESLVWNGSVLAYHEIYRQIAASGVRVILEGHGSDEMLAGYPYLSEIAMRQFLSAGRLFSAWGAARAHAYSINPALDQYKPSPLKLFLYLARERLRGTAGKLLRGVVATGTPGPPRPNFPLFEEEFVGDLPPYELPKPARTLSTFKKALYTAFHARILPNVLRVFDRASMAHSLESRAPFMDYRLVQYVFSLPDSDIVGGGYTKRIQREAMRPLLPGETIERRTKLGFSVALPTWFRDPSVLQALQEAANDGTVARAPGIKPRAFQAVLSKGIKQGGFTWHDTVILWQAYSYALLCERFLGQRS